MERQEIIQTPGSARAFAPVSAEIDLVQETPGRAVRVAEGFWILATQHHPGGSRSFPEINNRCLIFELVEAGARLLLVINALDPSAIAEVKRIERETGLAVRYVLSPGGGAPCRSTSSPRSF
jgi:hypothetical protein